MVVDDFFDDHRVYLNAGQHAKCDDFYLDELMDIHIAPVLLVGHGFIDVRLVFRLSSGFGFCYVIVERDFRHRTWSVVEGPARSMLVVEWTFSVSGNVGAVLNKEGFEARRNSSGLALVETRVDSEE